MGATETWNFCPIGIGQGRDRRSCRCDWLRRKPQVKMLREGELWLGYSKSTSPEVSSLQRCCETLPAKMLKMIKQENCLSDQTKREQCCLDHDFPRTSVVKP